MDIRFTRIITKQVGAFSLYLTLEDIEAIIQAKSIQSALVIVFALDRETQRILNTVVLDPQEIVYMSYEQGK